MRSRRGSLQSIARKDRWILPIEDTDSRLIRRIKRILNRIDLQQFRAPETWGSHLFVTTNHTPT